VKVAAGFLRLSPLRLKMLRLGECIADVLPSMGRLFAHYKIFGEAARIGTMTATVSICLVDRLEWRARKYYEISLLVLAHVMDQTTKGVGLKTGCTDLASWSTIMEFVILYGQLFGYDVGGSVDDSAGQNSTRCFMEHMSRDVFRHGKLSDGARIHCWWTALSASKEFVY
jgi:hypothetical protein